MDTRDLARKYLGEGQIMQIATTDGEQPWICTVYFVEDENLNLYWLSLPTRRHSREIAKNSKIAITVPVKFDQPVIGVQAEGTAEIIDDADEVAKVMNTYTTKYNSGEQFYKNFIIGKNQHTMYKFTPAKMYLVDEVNFSDRQRREVK